MEMKEKLSHIRKNLAHIDFLLNNHEAKEIIDDYTLLTSTLYTLQISIQELIDMGLRFLAEVGEKPPNRYSEIGELLKNRNVLEISDVELFKKIVGFRNIIVHRYTSINLHLLEEILRKRLYKDIYKLALKILRKAEELGIDP
ncbi:MAG: type VII toxin-antitoxin system HepT family RNase toxin [Candidatus Njordarchaeales archaeon]